MKNLLEHILPYSRAELFETITQSKHTLIERITSYSQTTPHEAPYQQTHDEWVMVLQGTATLEIENIGVFTLQVNDSLFIPKNHRHWVTHTDNPTVWLAVHMQ